MTSEIARRWSDRVSVFWFDAGSRRSIDRGFVTVADSVKMREPSRAPRAKRAFKDWLSDGAAGPWLVIFDNACPDLDLRGLLPNIGGKVIITARHTSILTDSGFAAKAISPLCLREATELFASRQTQGLPPRSTDFVGVLPTALSSLLQALADVPLAISLLAACMHTLDLDSTADSLQTLADETVPPAPPTLDPRIWKWGCHVLEELNPGDILLLGLVCVFDGEEISDDFLAALSNTAPPGSIFDKRQHTTIINKLQERQLIQRRRNPVQQHYHVPMAIRECVIHYLATRSNSESTEVIVNTATEALHAALEQSKLKSKKDHDEMFGLAQPHIKSLHLAAAALNVPISRDFHTARFALSNAILPLKKFSLRQFWRIWLLNGNFPLNETNQGEDDGAELIVQPTLAPWIVEMLSSAATRKSEKHQELRAAISEHIVSGFCEDLKLSTIMAVIGNCWIGVREDIFDFLRTHPGMTPRNAVQIDAIIDFVDKGACAGLQSMISSYLASNEYVLQMRQDCEAALRDVIDVVTAGLTSAGVDPASVQLGSGTLLDAAKLAVASSWEHIGFSSFFQIGGAFESTFKGSVDQCVCADIGSKLRMTIEPKGYETTTSLMLNILAEAPVKRRVSLVSRGYWEVMSALSLLFAADILKELSNVMENSSIDSGGSGSPSAKLMTIAIELAREAVMCPKSGTSPGWKSTLEKVAFWCVQAEECEDSRQVYRNQDRWEEYRILSGFGDNLPVGDAF